MRDGAFCSVMVKHKIDNEWMDVEQESQKCNKSGKCKEQSEESTYLVQVLPVVCLY